MSRGIKLDRQLLHEELWTRADGKGRLRINQAHFGDELGVDRVTVARIFAEFLEAGRMRKIKGGYRRVVMYEVYDPEGFK